MIEFRRVSKTYPSGSTALRDVTFKIDDGEFVFIIGRSGAGKSTLVKLLTCEEKPSAGRVLIDQFDVARIRRSLVPYLRRNIGMVFQDFRLIYTKTVYENVAFAMEIIGANQKMIRRRVPIVLSIVGLRDRANARPGELSGGEQQRVAIARAMVNNPMLILADEPTGNLDPTNSEAVMALLEEINRSGTTVVICSHDHALVDRMKKRVIEIDDGSMIRDDCSGLYAALNPACQTTGRDAVPPEPVPASDAASQTIQTAAPDSASVQPTDPASTSAAPAAASTDPTAADAAVRLPASETEQPGPGPAAASRTAAQFVRLSTLPFRKASAGLDAADPWSIPVPQPTRPEIHS